MEVHDFKLRLAAEIEKTTRQIEEYRELSQPIAPDSAIGRVSRMDAINNKSISEAALRKAEVKLRKFHYALDMADQEGFGLCSRCGQPIPEGRLLIMPESAYCVRCAF
jgi:DnaK suppressor protein